LATGGVLPTETYVVKRRGVRQSATGARSSADGDSPRRGDVGLRTDTAGTPSNGGSLGSLCKPCREEEGEVSAAVGGAGKGGDVAAL
jgi:hypothetical protein